MSEPRPHSHRLQALDGLRGISSILVLITHLKLDLPQIVDLIGFTPLRILVRTLMNTGNISVGYFFILCGFLMAYLYENPESYTKFVQKRYFRIFSVFIVAVLISFGVISLGFTTVIHLIALLILIPVVVRVIYNTLSLVTQKRFILIFFIGVIVLQVCIAGSNYLIVYRIGPQQFYSLPSYLYNSFIFLTNATLSFIFSDYIPMLDGGYWSLVTEVMFYLVYPIVAWLILAPIKQLSRRYWIFWYFASMTVFYGVSLLFKNLLSFETAHVHFAHFFTVGMMIAVAYKRQFPSLMKLLTFFETAIGQIVSIFMYLIPISLAFWLGNIQHPLTMYLVAYGLAPFMGLAVISILAQKNILSRIFTMRVPLFFGAISFPLYVIHSPIIHVFWKLLRVEQNVNIWGLYLLVTVIVSLLSAYYIHRVIESMYFSISAQRKSEQAITRYNKKIPMVKLLVFASVLVFVMLFVGFQKNFSILTLVRSHNTDTLKITNTLSENGMVKGSFRAYEDKLGIIMMRITHVGPLDPDRGVQEKKKASTVIFRIRQKGSNIWYHESSHVGWKISSQEAYPFGFPEIQSSRNVWYEFEIVSEGATPSDYVRLTNTMTEFRSVYKMSGSVIVRKPWILVPILRDKVVEVYSNPDVHVILLIYVFMIWFVWFINKKSAPKLNTA